MAISLIFKGTLGQKGLKKKSQTHFRGVANKCLKWAKSNSSVQMTSRTLYTPPQIFFHTGSVKVFGILVDLFLNLENLD